MTERQVLTGKIKRPESREGSLIPSDIGNSQMNKVDQESNDDIGENVLLSDRFSDSHRDKLRENLNSLNSRYQKFKVAPSFTSHLRNRVLGTEFSCSISELKRETSVSSNTGRSIQEAKAKFSSKVKRSIPCLSFSSRQSEGMEEDSTMTNKLLLFFHANGEDLNLLKPFLEYMTRCLNTSILAMEYPGYSLYQGQPSENQIIEDSEAVYDFAVEQLGVKPSDIVLVGRSLGSGPAVHLACHKEVFGLVLISPFASIKDVVKEKVGGILATCVRQRFDNLAKISQVRCKLKIIHGQLDDVVNVQQAKLLAGNSR